MRVSVIIPTFNRRALILQTLPTVLDQTFPVSDYEVIVVIDGSTDSTADVLRRISTPVRIRIFEQENRGQAAARNTGIRAATGELVLFLDDDLFCDRTLIAEHVAAHVNGNSLVFGPILVDSRSPKTLSTKWLLTAAQAWDSRLARQGVSWPIDAIVGANSSIRRDALVAIGGFDERFYGALEDWELGQRLWKRGVLFRYCPAAITHQWYAKSTDDLVLRDAPMYGANEVLLCRKRPEFRRNSTLACFTQGTWSKRKARGLSVRLPMSIDPILQLAERITHAYANIGMRILKARKALSFYRSAAKASGGWKQFEREYVIGLPVLLYHRVGPPQPGTYPELTVDTGRFRKQMGWLRRNGYTTIHAADWLAWCREGKPLPPKPVMVTFDDAYADLVQHAFPVLQENAFTATVFVVTTEIGGHNSWDHKNGCAAIRCMSADLIRHCSALGIEFGTHSCTHTDLTTLSASELEEEIAGSGRDLAEILDTMPLSFAYPFGMYDDAVRSCLEKTFQLAFTCDEGLNGLGTHPYLLRRTMIQPRDSLLDFALRVKFGWNPIESLRARIRLRTRLRGVFRMFQGS